MNDECPVSNLSTGRLSKIKIVSKFPHGAVRSPTVRLHARHQPLCRPSLLATRFRQLREFSLDSNWSERNLCPSRYAEVLRANEAEQRPQALQVDEMLKGGGVSIAFAKHIVPVVTSTYSYHFSTPPTTTEPQVFVFRST